MKKFLTLLGILLLLFPLSSCMTIASYTLWGVGNGLYAVGKGLYTVVSLPFSLLGSSDEEWECHKPEGEFATGYYKVGKPYTIKGKIYTPSTNLNYDEIGIASWYGEPFHGCLTANGELFDQDALTAAHKTLPLPSIVEVTNLENDRRVILRVNDRGPFTDDRIIDVSRKAAQRLNFTKKGTARVRVRVLVEASRAVAATLGGPIP